MSAGRGRSTGERLARGTSFSIVGQLIASCLGFLLVIFLGRLLGQEGFGRYGIIISLLAWVECLGVNGVPDTTARLIAAEEDRRAVIFAAAMRLEIPLALGLFVFFLLASPLLAGHFLHDRSFGFTFRLAALDIPLYALFGLHLGYLRGRRGFARYALGIVFYVALKFAAVVSFVLSGFSLAGALLGNAVGSAGGLILARVLVRRDLRPAPGVGFPARRILILSLPLLAAIVLFQATLSSDLWMVARLLPGQPAEVGLYTAVWNLARVPYFLLIGLSVSLFPVISRAQAAGDGQATARYLTQAFRLYFLVIIPLIVLVAATAPAIVGLTFGREFDPHDSGPLLAVLLAGCCLLCSNLVYTAALLADGRAGLCAAINASLLAGQLLLTRLFIPPLGLAGAALATLALGAASLLAGQQCLSRIFGARLRPLPAIRALVASAAPLLFAILLRARGAWLIAEGAGAGLLYLGALLLLGELSLGEVRAYIGQFRGGN